MANDSKFTKDSNNNTAVRVRLASADDTITNSDCMFTKDDEGNTAVRVVGISGGIGTSNYNDLSNKPKINGVTLSGDKSSSDLGIKCSVQVEVSGTATVEGFVVPKPTAEEMTAIYNAIVAGNNVYIVDSNDVYYQVLQADSIDGAINIEMLYFGEMALLYTLENDTVAVVGKKIGGESGDSKVTITLTGESGILNAAQIAQISNDTTVLEIVCDGEVYRLSNAESDLSYRTFMNIDAAIDSNVVFKSIYVQLNPSAANYGHWSKEVVPLGTGFDETKTQVLKNIEGVLTWVDE